MSIYKYKNYKQFLRDHIKAFPNRGRGQARRLALHLEITPVVVTQVLRGKRDFTADQAYRIAVHFGFDEREAEYFSLMVNHARADSAEFRRHCEKKMESLRKEVQDIKNLVEGKSELDEKNKAIFYSNWYFVAASLLTSIKGYNSVESIADYFGLSRKKTGEIVRFLLDTGLCVEVDGKIWMGTTSTHVDKTSEFVNSHRRNWRQKAIEKFTAPDEEDYFFSGPVSISKRDAEKFLEEILALISRYSKQVADSPAEELFCLNIDWFKF